MEDEPPGPVPWHVHLWTIVLSKPLVSSAVLALPIGLLVYGIAALGYGPWDVFTLGAEAPDMPPLLEGALGWVAGTLTCYVQFTKPY